jgi:hypothetical protein
LLYSSELVNIKFDSEYQLTLVELARVRQNVSFAWQFIEHLNVNSSEGARESVFLFTVCNVTFKYIVEIIEDFRFYRSKAELVLSHGSKFFVIIFYF